MPTGCSSLPLSLCTATVQLGRRTGLDVRLSCVATYGANRLTLAITVGELLHLHDSSTSPIALR